MRLPPPPANAPEKGYLSWLLGGLSTLILILLVATLASPFVPLVLGLAILLAPVALIVGLILLVGAGKRGSREKREVDAAAAKMNRDAESRPNAVNAALEARKVRDSAPVGQPETLATRTTPMPPPPS